MDHQTTIGRLGVAGYSLHDVPALISSNLSDNNALCGYEFLAHFPLLLDRDRQVVTLFPASSKVGRMHCIPIDVTARIALATVEINETRMSHIVLDSGMAGGGVMWEGARGLSCTVRWSPTPTIRRHPRRRARALLAAPSHRSATRPALRSPRCRSAPNRNVPTATTECSKPISRSVHAMAIDYPHRRMCFDVGGYVAETPAAPQPTHWHDAWSRFKSLRPPR